MLNHYEFKTKAFGIKEIEKIDAWLNSFQIRTLYPGYVVLGNKIVITVAVWSGDKEIAGPCERCKKSPHLKGECACACHIQNDGK